MTDYSANVRHAIYIERYKKRVAREIVEMIDGLTGSLFERVVTSDLERMNRRDLDRLLADLRRMVAEGYEPVTATLETALKDFAVYEAEWQVGALARAGVDLGVPSDADLWAAMYARPFQGRLLRDWLKDLPANTSARVRQTVRQGYVDGKGPLEIARDLRGTRGRKGVMDISRRGADMLARTAIAHTASSAREKTYEQNDTITNVQWSSVLDHRTSAICRTNDGRVGPVRPTRGWKPPAGFTALQPRMARPPAHVGCRSTMLPMTDGNRAALKVRPTYNDWLKQQPESVQDDILGPTRGKLYRSGDFTVDRFTDPTGQEYTLDQLRQRDREAFDEALAE